MKHLKRFNEAFQDTEYNKFMGLDISDIGSIKFIWSNLPFFSSYIDKNGNYSTDNELKMSLDNAVSKKLKSIKKEDFKIILEDNGLKPQWIKKDPNRDPNLNFDCIKITLEGRDLVDFFYIIENIEEFK